MIDWTFDHGVWRWRSPSGTYYRLEFKGGYWLGRINRRHGNPVFLGHFENANDGKAFCAEHAKNPAGTVTKGGRVDVLVEPLTAETVDVREAWRELV